MYDILGTIYKLTDNTDPENPVYEAIEGYHVNILPEDMTEDLQAFTVTTPSTPRRVFAGRDDTVFLCFADEAEFKEVQDILAAKQEAENTPEKQAALNEVANIKPISRRQAKQQLLIMGLLDDVQTAISAIPDPTERDMVQIYWDDSQLFERQHPLMIQIGTTLGLDAAQLNEAFKAAYKL